MPHHTLIDTCVLIDLACDPLADEIAGRIEDLIATTHFRLVVPQVVREEFDRHKGDCSAKLAKRLSARVKETIRFVRDYAGELGKAELLTGLEGFEMRIAVVAHAAARTVERIERLLDHAETKKLEMTGELLQAAARRGLEKKAPFGSRNGVADAIILESFLAFFGAHKPGRCTFSFVTLNKSDFAAPQDQRRPHPDLGEPFASGQIRYCINLADEINRLIKELPPAPKQEKKFLSEEVVRRVSEWRPFLDESDACPFCGAKALQEYGLRGFEWYMTCGGCGRFVGTGERLDA